VTTWEYAHARGQSTAGRFGAWARPRIGSAARSVGRGWRSFRPLTLPLAGLGCFVGAAFTVSTLAGLIGAGMACFVAEWRVNNK
jgi:hypothetical protein